LAKVIKTLTVLYAINSNRALFKQKFGVRKRSTDTPSVSSVLSEKSQI